MQSARNEYFRPLKSCLSASPMDLSRHQSRQRYRRGMTFGLLALTLSMAHAQTDYCQPNSPGSDPTADYCTQPNFPTYGTPTLPLPSNSSAAPGDGLLLDSSATNLFSVVMGSNQSSANMTTGQSVRDMFYMNYITGNLTQTLGSPMDTGQSGNTVFAAVARHYEVDDPNDLHLMEPDGLHLRAICSGKPHQLLARERLRRHDPRAGRTSSRHDRPRSVTRVRPDSSRGRQSGCFRDLNIPPAQAAIPTGGMERPRRWCSYRAADIHLK